jgi:hypothetical protein
MSVSQFLFDKSEAAASRAFYGMLETGGIGAWYCYYKRGDLIASMENPDPQVWKLAFNERLPCNLAIDALAFWIKDRARHVPCLPIG